MGTGRVTGLTLTRKDTSILGLVRASAAAAAAAAAVAGDRYVYHPICPTSFGRARPLGRHHSIDAPRRPGTCE